jgi:hypothetical protein
LTPLRPIRTAALRCMGTAAYEFHSADRLWNSVLVRRNRNQRPRLGASGLCYTPYWTTFELPPIDMKAASVGILDQIATGLR